MGYIHLHIYTHISSEAERTRDPQTYAQSMRLLWLGACRFICVYVYVDLDVRICLYIDR